MFNLGDTLSLIVAGLTVYGFTRNFHLFINFFTVLYYNRQYTNENRGIYTTYDEKVTHYSKNTNILLLFHGTTLPFKKVPSLGGNSNVYTIDIDPTTQPTIVGDATAPLNTFHKEYFDTIVVDICQCCVLDGIVQTGIKDFMNGLVSLLKDHGRLYISGLPLLCQKNGMNLADLNVLGLRAYLGDDINDSRNRSNTDPSYYVLVKYPEAPEMTDRYNLLNIQDYSYMNSDDIGKSISINE